MGKVDVARDALKLARAIAEAMWPNLPPEMTLRPGGAAMKLAHVAVAALDASPPETPDERQAAIVAWMREQPRLVPISKVHVRQWSPQQLADDIESGEWRRK